MTRRLSDRDAQLWAEVTATVTPLHPAASRPAPLPKRRLAPRPTLPPPATPAPPRPRTETLDRSWDRRLASGRVQPDLVIDLHGLSRESARQLLRSRIQMAAARGLRVILVITGKGGMQPPRAIDLMEERRLRGVIRATLPRWIAEADVSPAIAAIRRAHPRHGGSGAVYLILKRQRP